VRQVRKWCAGVLSALPFEHDWYRSHRVNSHYVGHPFFDELAQQKLDPAFLAKQRGKSGRIIGLLPGSRNGEIALNFSMMLSAASKIHIKHPEARFVVAAFSQEHAKTVRGIIAASKTEKLPIEVYASRTPEIIELSEACIAVSGSVSLELMFRARPAFMIYRLKPLTLWVTRQLFKLRSFTLVNLLAGESLLPEIATSGDESDRISHQILDWLNNPTGRLDLVSRLQSLRDRVAIPGACDRAASFLCSQIETKRRLLSAA
jgi:lipid-A-disaccharide synthase